MAARGRTAGFKMPEEHRDKIRNSNILSYLIEHALGQREMSFSQVRAAEILLRKVLPDLSKVEAIGDGANVRYVISDKPMTDDEWAEKYANNIVN